MQTIVVFILLVTAASCEYPRDIRINCFLLGDYDDGNKAQLVQGLPEYYNSYGVKEAKGVNVSVNHKQYKLVLWDTTGLENNKNELIDFCLNGDVFLVCFSVGSPTSFENIRSKWAPFIASLDAERSLKTPFLLVGTHTEMRGWTKNKPPLVSAEEGKKLAKEIGAVKYIECSTLTPESLENVFREAVLGA